MGEKGIAAIEKLPPDYYIPAPGSDVPGGTGKVKVVPGQAFPNGRPGYPIHWDDERGAWRPPGFTSTDSNEHIFNEATGQNGVWDGDKHEWIDAQTGKAIGYEQ